MVATALPITVVDDTFPTLPVGALSLDFPWTAADVANGNSVQSTGHELICVQNSGGAPYTVTVVSTPDPQNRSADLGPYTIGAGLFSVLPYFGPTGWRQGDGTIHLSASNVAVKFAVLRLPR